MQTTGQGVGVNVDSRVGVGVNVDSRVGCGAK